jgi:hypothetical protein
MTLSGAEIRLNGAGDGWRALRFQSLAPGQPRPTFVVRLGKMSVSQ